jgi:DNA-binding NarL/FixJ family response regulator
VRQLLEAKGYQIVGEAGSGAEAMQMITKVRPDIVLLDLAMPQVNGLEVLGNFSKSSSAIKVIMLTAGIDNAQLVRALQLGARAVVLKETASEKLFDAIDTVMTGKLWMGSHSATDLAEALQQVSSASPDKPAQKAYGLTTREVEIVGLVVGGHTNNEIAQKLSISERTVKNHLVTIFIKLGVSNRVELALFASQKGLVES